MTREVLDAFSQVHDSGTTIVMITHDPLCALRADRILYIQDGTIADALEQKR
jgi:putative ABC transport system ATP-binding protein